MWFCQWLWNMSLDIKCFIIFYWSKQWEPAQSTTVSLQCDAPMHPLPILLVWYSNSILLSFIYFHKIFLFWFELRSFQGYELILSLFLETLILLSSQRSYSFVHMLVQSNQYLIILDWECSTILISLSSHFCEYSGVFYTHSASFSLFGRFSVNLCQISSFWKYW